MSYIKKYITAFVVIYGCFIINGCAGNKSPIPEADCEPKWWENKDYISNEKTLYGKGTKSSHSRPAAKMAAMTFAQDEILSQLRANIIRDLEMNIENILKF